MNAIVELILWIASGMLVLFVFFVVLNRTMQKESERKQGRASEGSASSADPPSADPMGENRPTRRD